MTVERERVYARRGRLRVIKTIASVAVVALAAASAIWLVRGAASRDETDGGHLSVALTDFDGGRFTLASYEGRPVVVNFWASWCPSCVAEMPAFERVHQRFEGTVDFVGVNHSDERPAAEELAEATGVTYRLADDPQGELFNAFGGTGMPTTGFIDADGRIADVVVGQLTEQQLTALIEERLEVST